MIDFRQFQQDHRKHMETVFAHPRLFTVDVEKDELWNVYLEAFPPGTNEIYRTRTEHDCSCCRSFINQFGNVIVLTDGASLTIWGFETGSPYKDVVDILDAYVKTRPINGVFATREGAFGTEKNYEELEDGSVHTYHHFRVDLPKQFILNGNATVGEVMARAQADKEVFQRSLTEILPDAVETAMELISEKQIYRGDEQLGVLVAFQALQNEFLGLPESVHSNYCWLRSTQVSGAISRIRNNSIGVLLKDLSDGMDVAEAVRRYESVMAPHNYKRPAPVFTKKMLEAAEDEARALGILESLPRRLAHLDDITINNVIWANPDARREMEGEGVFEALAREVTVAPKQFDRLPGVGVETFINEILPGAKDLEVLMENRHERRLVSLVAPKNKDAPSLFKWGNGFSWAYNGNMADSSMKERVKAAGGDVTGVLRFSIQWNEDGNNDNDLDAHCIEPNGNHIFFPNKMMWHQSSGRLDVDIINPRGVAVENITWSDESRMYEGVYHFFVHCYSHRGGHDGFRAEIEYGGEIYEYDYPHDIPWGKNVTVAKVRFSPQEGIRFIESLPSTTSSRRLWKLNTNQWQPVSVVTYSPNYWDDRGVGNKHYFFFLAGAQNPDTPNGFFNEYLREDLAGKHKRVFAALGDKMTCDPSPQQLSGLGFSSTQRDSLIIRADGKLAKVIF